MLRWLPIAISILTERSKEMEIKNSNRPEGLPTTRALMYFWAFTALLLLDVALYQYQLIGRLMP